MYLSISLAYTLVELKIGKYPLFRLFVQTSIPLQYINLLFTQVCEFSNDEFLFKKIIILFGK